MHMTAVISCNKMWNDHTYLLMTLCKAGQHDYIVFLSNGYLGLKNLEPNMQTNMETTTNEATRMSSRISEIRDINVIKLLP